MTDEEPDDPFDDEAIGEADEIDDPFARLGEDGSETATPEAGTPEGEERPNPADADPDAERTLFDEGTTADRDPADAGVADRDALDEDRVSAADPFEDLGPATGDSDAALDEAFERMDVGDIAEEDVWESLDEDLAGGVGSVGDSGSVTPGADATGGASGEGLGARETGVERVISKRTYCQQCPHFSAPPEVACDHEGTSILESVGFDEFRVRDCPMVDDDDPTFDADSES